MPELIAGASRFAATQHNITNQYVGRAGDDLIVHSYAVALHFGADDRGTGDLAMGVVYRDRATRRRYRLVDLPPPDRGHVDPARHPHVVIRKHGGSGCSIMDTIHLRGEEVRCPDWPRR